MKEMNSFISNFCVQRWTSEMQAPLLHLNSPGLQGDAVVDGVVGVVTGS